MIDRQRLLADLRALVKSLEKDLLERSRSAEIPEIGRALAAEHARARAAERTTQTYEEWRADRITQTAAAWTLSAVFARFLEDNGLIDPPRLAGPGEQLRRALDERELYFRAHPVHSDRDYLLALWDELERLPAAGELFGARNPIRELPNWLSGDAAGELLRFFQRIDAGTGALLHDFTDPDWDTRFLGDLYQDLSDEARKRYALLQTPIFVEEFILDRTLDPALAEFGLPGFRLIDPACGSGHFLLGAFARLFDRWQRREPGAPNRVLAQRALESVCGVDINADALAIARFRLLLAALRACGIRRLADAPDFSLNLACGDSLLHAPLQTVMTLGLDADDECDHAYPTEDLLRLRRLLEPGRYHAVVANPPYITPKDPQLNARYRKRFLSCHMKYALSVPFMEQLFRLAIRPAAGTLTGAGYVGQITANSFMKREFGRKLVEQFLPTVDLTHVIDTSLAYIPGHGTPTVILFGRNRKPVASTVRAVMGIMRENAQPSDPARGIYWQAMLNHVDTPGAKNQYVSIVDAPRSQFYKHPWSMGGGGVSELKERIEGGSEKRLGGVTESIGITAFTLEDDIFTLTAQTAKRHGLRVQQFRTLVVGDSVRDWLEIACDVVVFPYDQNLRPIANDPHDSVLRYLWQGRICLANSRMFGGKTKTEYGLRWYEFGRLTTDKFRSRASITFAFVSTHNQFVLDACGSIFNRTAPVIKLPLQASEEDHLNLLGALNSSAACLWFKQVCHDKGGGGIGGGIAAEAWERFFEFNASNVEQFPLPAHLPLDLAHKLHDAGHKLQALAPETWLPGYTSADLAAEIVCRRQEWERTRERMIALQEELDWQCYRLYSLLETDFTLDGAEPPPLRLGERAFEIAMARKMEAGELETTWFARHGSTPIPTLPAHWPAPYRLLVERRLARIESDADIALIEQPEYKRRWNTEAWEAQVERALRCRLLDRMESWFDFDGRMNTTGVPTARLDPYALTTLARLADIARQDPDFMQAAAVYRADPTFEVAPLVEELVLAESVPLLPVLRYTESGRDKRAAWERTWELQRREDRGETVEAIPVPPKYAGADFADASYWRLRGKLDVPKERWVTLPHCQGADGTLPLAWAGCDALRLARAVSAWYVEVQERIGGSDDPRLIPLLAALAELLPWIKQWHNEIDPEFHQRMGDYFEGFLLEEARRLGCTVDEIRAWQPPATANRARRRRG